MFVAVDPLTLEGLTVASVPPPASTSAFTVEYRIVTELVALPRALTVPFNVAAVVVMLVADSVVTSGASGLAPVVNESVAPLAVPPALVADARK
jgi:hypothetical protein